MPLRRKTVEKEAVFVVLGINFEGIPEVLTFDIRPSETKEAREEVFKDVKKRGVTSARILASDGFAGINELVKDIFPGCLYQRCFIHLCRNLMKKVRQKDKKKIAQDFMELAQKENGEQASKVSMNLLKNGAMIIKLSRAWQITLTKNIFLIFIIFLKS